MGTVAIYAWAFAIIMVAMCWRLVGQQARKRRCTDKTRGVCTGTQNSTWVHGDAGDEAQLSRPVYRYEYNGESHEFAAGVATMLFERSPAAANIGKPIELQVNPSNPAEIYDPAYERWFAMYRVLWGVAGCVGFLILMALLGAIG